jgi:transcription elongation factor Elf1
MSKFSCSACSTPLVSITIERGASKVTMFSCSRCDHRWWSEGESQVDRGRVYEVVGTKV